MPHFKQKGESNFVGIMTLKLHGYFAIQEWRDINPLRKWRRENGFTISEVANYLWFSMSAVRNWETGVSYPKTEAFSKLANLIGDSHIESQWRNWWEARPQMKGETDAEERDSAL